MTADSSFRWMRILSISLLSLVSTVEARAATPRLESVRITYVGSERVYLDAGRSIGLRPGDTLRVQRELEIIGLILVTHAATKSAAANVISSSDPIKEGDRAILPAWARARVSSGSAARTPAVIQKRKHVKEVKSRPHHKKVRGEITFQVIGRQDMTPSGISWIQPGVKTRLDVQDIGGLSADLSIRHRSRAYYRSNPVATGRPQDEWIHRVFEFGIVSNAKTTGSQWGAGRVLVSDVRGMGYIDGGYYTRHWNSRFRSGVAFGSSPDPRTSAFTFGNKKAGVFGAYEWTAASRQRLVLSGALSTEYTGSTVSRDFLYLQGVYSRGSLLSLYQSVELDFNRSWRYAKTGNRLTMSNVYSMFTANLGPRLGFDISYDARRQYRYSETREIPDSLFNDDLHRGWRAGVRLNPLNRVFLRANGGIRLNESDSVESRFLSVTTRLTRFPWPRQSVSFVLSIVDAGVTTGYRPVISYRFPLSRGFYMTLSGAAHVYKSPTTTTTNVFIDASSSKAVGSRYFLTGNLRQYLDNQLRSTEFYLDVSVKL